MLVLFLAVAFLASLLARRKPTWASIGCLIMWATVPAYGSEALTGVDYFAENVANLHPSSLFLCMYVFVSVLTGAPWTSYIVRLPTRFLLLLWLVGFGGLLTVVEGASLRGFIDNFMVPIIWLALSCLAATLDEGFERWFCNTFIVAGLLNVAYSTYQVSSGEFGVYEDLFRAADPNFRETVTRSFGLTDHPLVLSLLMISCICVAGMIRSPFLRSVCVVLLFVGVLQSGSRAGLILGGLAVIVVMLFRGRRSVIDYAAVLAVGVSGILLYLGSTGQGIADRFLNDSGSAQLRNEAYVYFGSSWEQYLFYGGGFASNFDLKDSGMIGSSLENGYVMFAVDFGLVACLVLIGAQLSFVVDGLRRGAAPRAMAVSALLTMVLASTFSSIGTRTAALPIIFAGLVAIFAASNGRLATSNVPTEQNSGRV